METTSELLTLLGGIARQPEKNHDLASLAARYGSSRFVLHREFSRVAGETPRQFVQRQRLTHAAGQLATTSKSIFAIALSCGFTSHEVFVRAFRRHFHCTPSQYRRRVATKFRKRHIHERRQYMSRIRTAAPCLGLFHIPTGKKPRTSAMPTSEISRKVIEPQPILYIRREVVPTQLQALFTECFPVIFGHAMQQGAAIAGNPMARYITVGQGSWTVDSIVPLLKPAEGGGQIEAGFLHGGPVATATHSGTYETLAETYSAIEKWVKEQGYTALGGNWEWYVTDPGEHPNPADWKTEVFWPLAE